MNSLIRRSAILLVLLASTCFGQIYSPSLNLTPTIKLPPRYSIKLPAFSEPTNRIAYVQQSGNTQTLKLARLSQSYFTTKANSIKTMATVASSGSTTEEILDLFANPSNSLLATYTYQDYFDFFDAFTDHNVEFYSMLDGAPRGLINEHAFSGLNSSFATSQRLEEFKQAELDYGVPPEVVDTYDYGVITEGVTPASPTYRWNSDGTFTYSIELDVVIDYGGGYSDFIGSEVFSLTVAITPGGATRLGFNLTRTPATYPSTFTLTPNRNAAGEYIKLNGSPIQFTIYDFYFNGRRLFRQDPRIATMVEGNIPTAYTTLSF